MPAIATAAAAAYVITLRNSSNKFSAVVYPDRAAADAAAEAQLDGLDGNVWVIQNEDDVLPVGGKMLLEMFNSLTDSGVKKFESMTVGTKRLLSVLPQVAKQPPKPAQNHQETTKMSDDNTEGKKGGRKPVNASHPTRANWKKIRTGSMRARIAQAMFDGFKTVQQIADAANVPTDRVLPHIYATGKDCGIGYHVENEQYKLDVPAGVKTFEELLQEEKEAAE